MGAETQPQNGPTEPQPIYQENGAHKGYQSGVNPAMVQPTPLHLLGEASAIIDCPYCSRRGPTRIDEHDSSMTIVAGIGIGILCICAACLPCLLHWFQDVDHFCSHCNQRVAHIPHGGIAQVVQPQHVPQGYNMGQQPQYGGQPQHPVPQNQTPVHHENQQSYQTPQHEGVQSPLPQYK